MIICYFNELFNTLLLEPVASFLVSEDGTLREVKAPRLTSV